MRIKQKRIYLFLTLLLLLGMNHALWAQSLQVTGTVTDDQGIPIPGVTVMEKGTKKGANTDINGVYKFDTSSKSVLVFTYIGFETKEVSVNNQRVINLKMKTSTTSLDEVLIVAYGQQKKVTVTGAFSTINAEQLSKSPSANVANTLAGQITGITTVQSTGRPGADDPRIFVRGVASLSEDRSQPLMVVDGVERSFMDLDADEIQTISVLKDASATAVYGVRGANGVILVTTKRGTKGKATITASFSKGMQQATKLLDFADSYTYAQRYNEAQLNDDPNLNPSGLKFSPQVLEAFRTNSDPIMFPNTDWLGYILKPFAEQSRGNVNISGGNDNVKYFASLGVLSQDGLFKTFDSNYDYNFSFQRYNFRTNLDIDVTKTTKIGVTIGGQVGVRNQPQTKSGMNELFREIYWSVPYSGPGIVDEKYILSNDTYIAGNKKDGLDPFYGLGYSNILENKLNFDIDLNQKLDFVNGLTFRTKLSYNTNYNHTKNRGSTVIRYTPFYLRDLDPNADQNSDEIVYRTAGTNGNLSYGESQGKDRNWYFETGLNYNQKFGGHNVGSLLLYNQQKDFYPTEFPDIPSGLVGLAGRVTYDYENKYMADFNIGYNGSENFAKAKRFGVFPAVSAGWLITKESFMEEALPFISYMKVRMSYGLVGNDKIGGNRFLYLPDSYDSTSGSYSFGTDNPSNVQAAREGQIGNADVTWEKATKQNFGVDLKLFKDKLGITMEVFKENRKDILAFRGTVPGYVAYALPAINIGEVENKGFEIEVRWNHKVNKSLRYWINGNVSHAANKIIYMDEVPQSEDYLYRTGHPVGQPFGYIFDRFYNVNDATNTSIPDHQYTLKPGDMVYKDLNADGVIDQDDQKAIGYPTYPLYNFGLNLGFDFKNFDLTMNWAGAANTSRLLGETYRIAFGATSDRSLLQYMADDRWTPENADTATYPRMTLTGTKNNSKDSDFWLRDASYVRLKTLEMGYNFKGAFLKKMGITNLRLFLNGNNLVTFSKLDITDPESRTASDSEYPLTKIYNLGVKLNFL